VGTNYLGQPANQTTVTNASGAYSFDNLLEGVYQLIETRPAGYIDGADTIGTPGGTTGNDTFTSIVLPAGFAGMNNNFAEFSKACCHPKPHMCPPPPPCHPPIYCGPRGGHSKPPIECDPPRVKGPSGYKPSYTPSYHGPASPVIGPQGTLKGSPAGHGPSGAGGGCPPTTSGGNGGTKPKW
jgi:hypothetical protein